MSTFLFLCQQDVDVRRIIDGKGQNESFGIKNWNKGLKIGWKEKSRKNVFVLNSNLTIYGPGKVFDQSHWNEIRLFVIYMKGWVYLILPWHPFFQKLFHLSSHFVILQKNNFYITVIIKLCNERRISICTYFKGLLVSKLETLKNCFKSAKPYMFINVVVKLQKS
jgi:hypothetical protein